MSITGRHPSSQSPPAWSGALPVRQRTRHGRRRARPALLARCRGDALDRELAAGADPRDNPLLTTRAQQLTTPRSRRQLAAGLARAQRDVASELSALTAVVMPDRHEVAAAVKEIAALQHRLCDGERMDATGAAMLRLLLSDATSPLYDPVGPGSLARHLRRVGAALEPHL